MNYILVFMYIFAFKIYKFLDSAMLIGIGLTIFAVVNKEYRKKIIDFMKSKQSLVILFCFLGVAIWGCLCTLINATFDFSYIKTLIHFFGKVFIGYELIAYLQYKQKLDKVVNYIIVAFIIQTILQWIFLLNPSISKVFNCLRSESMVTKNIKYGGLRGLAITTGGFFSLSSAYGLIFVLYFTKYNTLFKNNIIKILMFLFLLTGTFFAGRTGFVGLIFVVPVVIVNFIKCLKDETKRKNIKKQITSLLICLCIFIAFIMLTQNVKKINKLYNYAFELVKNTISGKGVSTTSTTTLLKMYDVDISTKALFIGDGKYTEVNNGIETYYKKTDVGYFRKILYFGIIGLILSIILQIALFRKIDKKIIAIVLAYFLTLELKGEIIGFNIMVNSIVALLSAGGIKEEQNVLREEQSNATSNGVDDNI